LLASITGFKGGLKKVQTVDKSSPIISKEGEKPAQSKGGFLGELEGLQKKKVGGPTNVGIKKEPSQQMTPTKQPLNIPVKQQMSSTPSKQSLNIPNKQSQPSFSKSQSDSSPSNNSSSGSSGGISSAELQALKEEILTEMRKEIQQMKDDILAAILTR